MPLPSQVHPKFAFAVQDIENEVILSVLFPLIRNVSLLYSFHDTVTLTKCLPIYENIWYIPSIPMKICNHQVF